MKGFHNSFERYCKWCEEQTELKMSWGEWWDKIANKEE